MSRNRPRVKTRKRSQSGRGDASNGKTFERLGKRIIDTAQPNGTLAKTEAYPVELKATATTHQQISRRAYELYLERGQLPGFEQEDWLEAEKQLLQSPETYPAKDRF